MILVQSGTLEAGEIEVAEARAGANGKPLPPVQRKLKVIVFNVGLGPAGVLQIAIPEDGARVWQKGLAELLDGQKSADIQVTRHMPPTPPGT